MLETRLLVLFVALADDLHFGRAADRLGVAQSALSQGIRRLEDGLGTVLFERGGRTAVRLTRAGATFLGEARATLARLDQAERLARLAGRGEAGPLVIGYVLSAAICGLLPDFLRRLRVQLPLLAVHPQQMETPEQLAALAEGRLDIGLIRPRPVYAPPIVARVMHREPLALAMAAGHPLTSGHAVAPHDLAGETFIIPAFHETSGLVDHLHRLAARGAFALGTVHQVGDFVTAFALAAAGHGLVLAPRSLIALAVPGLVWRDLVDHDDTIALALAWRDDFADAVRDRAVAVAIAP